jgi:hypothetical protein
MSHRRILDGDTYVIANSKVVELIRRQDSVTKYPILSQIPDRISAVHIQHLKDPPEHQKTKYVIGPLFAAWLPFGYSALLAKRQRTKETTIVKKENCQIMLQQADAVPATSTTVNIEPGAGSSDSDVDRQHSFNRINTLVEEVAAEVAAKAIAILKTENANLVKENADLRAKEVKPVTVDANALDSIVSELKKLTDATSTLLPDLVAACVIKSLHGEEDRMAAVTATVLTDYQHVVQP